jgi:hypothetical protein
MGAWDRVGMEQPGTGGKGEMGGGKWGDGGGVKLEAGWDGDGMEEWGDVDRGNAVGELMNLRELRMKEPEKQSNDGEHERCSRGASRSTLDHPRRRWRGGPRGQRSGGQPSVLPGDRARRPAAGLRGQDPGHGPAPRRGTDRGPWQIPGAETGHGPLPGPPQRWEGACIGGWPAPPPWRCGPRTCTEGVANRGRPLRGRPRLGGTRNLPATPHPPWPGATRWQGPPGCPHGTGLPTPLRGAGQTKGGGGTAEGEKANAMDLRRRESPKAPRMPTLRR